MAPEPKSEPSINIDTGGGNYVGGDVHAGKDFVSRDKTEIGTQNNYYSTLPPTVESVDASPAPGESPYQGMEYFDVADADRFFGREQLTAELIEHLRHNPLLAIVGASGSGKSSLARAGLIPALNGTKPLIDQSQPPKGSSRWTYHIITPTSHPLESLAASLTRHSESVTATSTLIDDLRKDPRSLHLAARRLVSGGGNGAQRLLLVVDQFEELFTLCKDEAEQQAFVANLLKAATADGVVTLVLTLRADFYHRCAKFTELRNALETQQKYIGAMSPDELRRAIEEPARTGKWEFQEGLVEQLLTDVGNEPGALPLLSHALLETWKRRSGRKLTLTGYQASGKVQGAIAKSADEIYREFSDPQKSIARTIFLRLTELGEGSQDTRRRVRPEELKLTHASPNEVQSVLKILADARLVTTDDDEVQVAHEALIRAWQTLRGWLDDDREGNRIQRRLTEAANQWLEYGKDANLLYRGVLLQQAQEWLKSTIDLPNQIEMTFLDASQHEAEAALQREADLATEREENRQKELENQRKLIGEQSRRARIFRNAVVVATTLFLLAATSAVVSFYLNSRLKNTNSTLQETVSETRRLAAIAVSRQLASLSVSQLGSDYELALLLSVESGRAQETGESLVALNKAISFASYNLTLLQGHTERVNSAEWSKDESKVLTSSEDRTARIWDATNGKELVVFSGHTDSVLCAEWNSTGSKILTGSSDGTARIWDAVSGKEISKFEGHTGDILQVAWNKDESKILTTSNDQTAIIWDVASQKQLLTFTGQRGIDMKAMWNIDETKLLTTGTPMTVRVWDATSGKLLTELNGHTGAIWQASWSKDGSKILTSSEDQTARIWDVASGGELIRLERHTDSVNSATWSQDEKRILTASFDNTVRVWGADNGKELLKFNGTFATWSQDGSKILTNDFTGSAQIWNPVSGDKLFKLEGFTTLLSSAFGTMKLNKQGNKILLFSEGDNVVRIVGTQVDYGQAKMPTKLEKVDTAMWNKTENRILTIGDTNTVYVWDATNGIRLVQLTDHTDSVRWATWNKDESKILTESTDQNIRIWDAKNGKLLTKLDEADMARWSQGGNKILIISLEHRTGYIWDLVNAKQLLNFGNIDGAEWSKDESEIVTWSHHDSEVYIRDANSGELLNTLACGTRSNQIVIWSNDGKKVLISSTDGSICIFDVSSGRRLANFIQALGTDRIHWVAWSPNDSRILTGSDDNGVSIWDTSNGHQLIKLVGHTEQVYPATWSSDNSKILTWSDDKTVRIWNSTDGRVIAKFAGNSAMIIEAAWSNDERMLFAKSADGILLVWDTMTGKVLARIEGVKLALWSQKGNKILTTQIDGTARIWYLKMSDLLVVGCQWVPRNFTWSEWSTYIADNVGAYRPTCPKVPIPPDAIAGIQEEAHQQILAGQVISGTQRLEELNGWLKENGQFDSFGVDADAFVAEVLAITTTEALPSPTATPEPQAIQTLHPPVQQPASPLVGGVVSPLALPTVSRP